MTLIVEFEESSFSLTCNRETRTVVERDEQDKMMTLVPRKLDQVIPAPITETDETRYEKPVAQSRLRNLMY